MDNLKQQFIEKLLSTDRGGMENVIKHLERLGFFTAPLCTIIQAADGLSSALLED
jgi:hypothetical protein